MRHAPLPEGEQAVLEQLLAIRDELSLLKQDRSTYIKSHDVLSLYNRVIEQVHGLNSLRGDKELEQNKGW
jgi:hypothetical protein